MREILFRAKRIDNGEWVEGDLSYIVHRKERMYVFPADGLDSADCYEVEPRTLCQFTGLMDKNGKRIWENDIVNCGANLRVSWHTFKASWVLSKKGWMYNHFFGEAVEPEDVEVVGNFFDNPELLERG